jgi:hypothetical protein
MCVARALRVGHQRSVPATVQRLPAGLRETEGSVVVVTSRPTEDGGLSFAYKALVSRDVLFLSR